MNNKEQEYFEIDSFWIPQNIKKEDMLRIEDTYKLIPNDVHSLVDVGCGNGIFLNYIKEKKKSLKLLGVDQSGSALKHVKTETTRGNITKIPLEDKSFDLVSALEVIEHLAYEDYELGLKELSRIAKKYILVSVPYKEHLRNNFIRCPNCESMFSRSYHKNTFEENKLLKLFDRYNFKCSEIKYLGKKKDYMILSPIYRFFRKKFLTKHITFVCPVCGFSRLEEREKENQKKSNPLKRSLLRILDVIWPKSTSYRWILCLYRRSSRLNN